MNASEIELRNQMIKTAKEITANLTGEDKFYATRKITAAEKSGTLKAAKTAAEDIVLIAEQATKGN